jgi:opacity protein-like surface antigen
VGYEENASSGGLINDDFDRWIYGLSTELVLGPRLTADVGYRYIDKNSDAKFQSYEQNQFRIFFKYDF